MLNDQIEFFPEIQGGSNVWKVNVICHSNRIKEKKTDDYAHWCRKSFDKIQHLIMIKTVNQLRKKETSLIW